MYIYYMELMGQLYILYIPEESLTMVVLPGAVVEPAVVGAVTACCAPVDKACIKQVRTHVYTYHVH